MIRVTFSKYALGPESPDFEQKVTEYPGSNAVVENWMGNPGMTAIMNMRGEEGIQEVIAVLDSRDIEKLEEVPDEG